MIQDPRRPQLMQVQFPPAPNTSLKDDLQSVIRRLVQGGILMDEALREFKRRFILHVLVENNGNQSKAAVQLGMHRNTLSRTIRELGIDARDVRDCTKKPSHRELPERPYAVRSGEEQ